MHTKKHTLLGIGGILLLAGSMALLTTSEMLKTDAILISAKWTKEYVQWTEVENAKTGPRGLLVKNTTEPETYGMARSVQQLPSGRNLLLSFGVSGTGFLMAGFDDGSTDDEHSTFGITVNNGKVQVRHGTEILTEAITSPKDRFQIELQRDRSRIVYRKNGKTFFMVTEDSRKELRVKAFLEAYQSAISNVALGIQEEILTIPTATPSTTLSPTPSSSTTPSPSAAPTIAPVPTPTSGGPTPLPPTGTIGGVELPRAYVDSSYPTLPSDRTVRSVKTTCGNIPNCFTDFQAALNAARPGDEVVMDAGFTAVAPSGGFTLPNKNSTQWIVVRTANITNIPPVGTRVSPSHASQMPKILTNDNQAAIRTANGASHYRFVGVEISATGNVNENSGLVMLGSYSETNVSNQAHHIIFDRTYVHGLPGKNTRRGFFLNSGETAIVDSYLSEFHDSGADAQAILGDNGPGPLKLANSYLEASGENFMIGGIDAAIRGVQMSDVEIRGNHIAKPLAWKNGPWVIKNLLELKNGQRVLIDGNVIENNWPAAQSGMALNIKTVNQDGTMDWAHTRDVTVTNNIIRHAEIGVVVVDRDNNGPSGSTSNVRIENNLFDDIAGTFMQSLGAVTNVVVRHNTVLNRGNAIVADGAPANGFTFADNTVFLGTYGIKGSGKAGGNDTISTFFPGSTFRKNAFVGSGSGYPADNYYPANAAAVGFTNHNGGNGGDYRLSPTSSYKNAGTDGRDVGADVAAVASATVCAVSGNCGNVMGPPVPTPTPTPTTTPTPTPTPIPTPVPTQQPTPVPTPTGTVAYLTNFSTYLGGSGYDSIRDIVTTPSGDIYVVGGTDSSDFPRTTGQSPAGNMDVFVTKMTSTGQVIWSQLIGGANYDRAYGVELDPSGNVYISGRAGRGFPLKNALQTSFNGYYTGDAYRDQNLFLAKLTSAGTILWSTYVGTADMARDLAVDSSGNVYLASNYNPSLGQTAFPSAWFTNAFQKTPQGGVDEVIIKVDTNGTGVQWATYLGGSGNENPKISIRVDGAGNLVILSDTASTNAPTLNAYQSTNRGGAADAYLVKMKPDGSGLLWATYFGGSGTEYNETHHLGLDAQNNAYIAIMSQSSDAPTTVGAYDRTYNGESAGGYFHAWGDSLVAKFTPSGQLVASTYVGGNGGDGPQGLGVDNAGNVYFSGGTTSTNFPVTSGAAVTSLRGGEDVIGVRLSADFSKIDYATYLGTASNEEGRVVWADGAGSFYVGCEVGASGMQPVANALQSSFGGGSQDACVAKFSPR